MAQIAGSYKLDKNENFTEYLTALGVAEELVQKASAPGFTSEIVVDGNKYSFKSSSGIDLTFVLGEEFDEPMPIGISLKSIAKLDGNKMTITSKAPDGRTGARTYDFTDTGYVVTLTHNDIVAKRYFVRV